MFAHAQWFVPPAVPNMVKENDDVTKASDQSAYVNVTLRRYYSSVNSLNQA